MPPFLHKKHVKRDDLVMYTVEIPTCNFEILHAEKMNCHIAMHLKYCRGPFLYYVTANLNFFTPMFTVHFSEQGC